MATLEKIRSKAVLLVVVVGLALFAFIIGDFLRSGSTFFNQKKENIVVVNGQTTKIQAYQQQVEERTNTFKARNNGVSVTEEQTNQIRQAVLDEIIDKALLAEEGEKVGLTISEDELTDLIMGENISPMLQQIPDFQDPQTQRFDKNRLLQFLQMINTDDYTGYNEEMYTQLISMKKNWLLIEDQIKEQQLRGKLISILSAAIGPNNLDAKAAYENNKTSVDFDYIVKTYASVPDEEVSVSDAEIAKLYNERKTRYKQQEAKLIDYITVNILPSPQDYQTVLAKLETIKTRLSETEHVNSVVTENSELPYLDAYVSYEQLTSEQKQLVDSSAVVGTIEGPVLANNIYNLYKLEGQTVSPDSVHINLISLPVTAEEAVIKHLSDSLIAVIKSGTPFADVATSASNGQSNGDIGWQTESSLVKQTDVKFKDEVFAAQINELMVLQSAFGNYLVQVVEKTLPVKKYKIATVQLTVTPSQETKTKLYNDLNQYISSNHTLDAFKGSAAEAGYIVQSEVEVSKDQLNIANLQTSRQVIQWAFKNKKGAISDIYEVQNQEYFIVAAVEGALKEGYRSLESVSEILKRELLNDKKAEKIIADLKAKNLTDLTQYAEATNTNVQSVKFVTFATSRITGIGNEPVLNARAPQAPVGKISGPYKGSNGVYVINVTDKKESEEPFDLATQKQALQRQNGYLFYQIFQSNQILRENAKIENNFNRFF
jgi:peptidyl-prolyl cis-trans isomerase D